MMAKVVIKKDCTDTIILDWTRTKTLQAQLYLGFSFTKALSPT